MKEDEAHGCHSNDDAATETRREKHAGLRHPSVYLSSDNSALQVTVSVRVKCLWHTLEAISNVSTGGKWFKRTLASSVFIISASDLSFQSSWHIGDVSQLQSASAAACWVVHLIFNSWLRGSPEDLHCVHVWAYMTDSPCLVCFVRWWTALEGQ